MKIFKIITLKCSVRWYECLTTSLQCHTMWFSSNKKKATTYLSSSQMKEKCNFRDKEIFLTACEPHLQRTVLWCWQHLRAITSLFNTCAKVVRQDNEVLASSDSLQHCSISYVKQADPGY